MKNLKVFLFLLLAVPVSAYQGGTTKNHAHTSTSGDGGALTPGVSLLGASPLNVIHHYRKPNLTYVSTATVTPEGGLSDGVANNVQVLFPDNTSLSMSNTNYMFLDIRKTASLLGTPSPGLRSGLTIPTTGFFDVYAVRLQDNTTSFVIVGDTISAIGTNYAALNSFYGTNNWEHLGDIAIGDGNGGSLLQIVQFYQAGNVTWMINSNAGRFHGTYGVCIATTSSTTTLNYTYASGMTGRGNLPPNFTSVDWGCDTGDTSGWTLLQALTTLNQLAVLANNTVTGGVVVYHWGPVFTGVSCTESGSSTAMGEYIGGWVDNALGVGGNPLF